MPAIFVRRSTRREVEDAVARHEVAHQRVACLTCHATRSAAPLTGFAPAWKPRLAQGMDVLLAHARDGYKGMPAKGLCSDCTDTDLRGLIAFMSQAQ